VIRTLLLVLLVATPAAAEEPTPLRWREHAAVPARASDALVISGIGLATIDAWRAPRRGRALTCLAVEHAVTIAATEILKRAVGRRRPDGTDALSMPAGHTALAALNTRAGWRASLTVGVGWGRQAAGRHYATDVLAGAGIGFLADRICEER
jgi:membrane-associated phospholipid phosphatase